MPFTRARRRLTTWLALLAMVLGALAPTVAQAVVAASDRAEWIEVCGASGMVWVQVEAEDGSLATHPGQGSMADGSQHCPWCSLHGGAAGLPVVPVVSDPPPGLAGPLPTADPVSPRPATWAPPQARAPPLSV
jgi:hypothetical protein